MKNGGRMISAPTTSGQSAERSLPGRPASRRAIRSTADGAPGRRAPRYGRDGGRPQVAPTSSAQGMPAHDPQLPQAPWYFSGMAPMAARRAKSVQRSGCQGLRGDHDACHPRRGSACDVSEHGAPAEAQQSTRKGHAASVRRQSRQRLRSGFGGESFPAKRRQWRIKRAGKKERRDWRASLARESQCRDGSKGTVEGVSFAACGEANDLKLVPTKRAAMHARFLRANYSPPPPWILGPGPAGPGGFPTAFDIKSGAPAGQARPRGSPGKWNAGGWYPPLRAWRLPAPRGVDTPANERRVRDAAPYRVRLGEGGSV